MDSLGAPRPKDAARERLRCICYEIIVPGHERGPRESRDKWKSVPAPGRLACSLMIHEATRSAGSVPEIKPLRSQRSAGDRGVRKRVRSRNDEPEAANTTG